MCDNKITSVFEEIQSFLMSLGERYYDVKRIHVTNDYPSPWGCDAEELNCSMESYASRIALSPALENLIKDSREMTATVILHELGHHFLHIGKYRNHLSIFEKEMEADTFAAKVLKIMDWDLGIASKLFSEVFPNNLPEDFDIGEYPSWLVRANNIFMGGVLPQIDLFSDPPTLPPSPQPDLRDFRGGKVTLDEIIETDFYRRWVNPFTIELDEDVDKAILRYIDIRGG